MRQGAFDEQVAITVRRNLWEFRQDLATMARSTCIAPEDADGDSILPAALLEGILVLRLLDSSTDEEAIASALDVVAKTLRA